MFRSDSFEFSDFSPLNDDKIYYNGFCINSDDPHKSRMESRPEQGTCPRTCPAMSLYSPRSLANVG